MQLRVASPFLTILFVLGLGSAAGASNIVGGGLADSWACPDGSSPCSSNADFLLDPPSPTTPAVGTIDFNGATVDITLTVPTFSMTGSSGSVTDLDFTNIAYTATLSVLSFPAGGGLTSILQNGAATGSVTGGTYDQVGGPGSGPLADDLSVSFTNFNCLVDANGVGTCGFTVGAVSSTGDFALDVDGAPYDVVQNFNVIVPEPSGLALVGLGLITLAIRRRR